MSSDGYVLGTYLHGLFHNESLRRSLLSELAKKKGITFNPTGRVQSKEDQYDRLASLVRGSLDMEFIYRTVGLERG